MVSLSLKLVINEEKLTSNIKNNNPIKIKYLFLFPLFFIKVYLIYSSNKITTM